MGRSGQSSLIIGISAAAVLVVGTTVALTRGAGPVSHAATTFGQVRGATVVSVDGLSRPARPGAALAPGEVVTTGRHGNAELMTRGRITLLGSNAALAVRDGARQQLRTGTAVIDAQHGPGLTLDIAGDTLVVPGGSATEADRAVAVRIGSLAGPASLANGSGRYLNIPALWQVVTSGDSLPSAPSPLQLTDSPAETRAVPELVADNIAMKTLARGIDTTGTSTAHVVEAAWTGTVVPLRAGVTRSDQVLPVVIADAAQHAGGTPQQRYNRVVGWRAQGGSWGVVIHLLSTQAAQVADTLQSLQQAGHAGTGSVAAGGVGKTAIGPGAVTTRRRGSSPVSSNNGPSTTPTTSGSKGGSSTPTPTPSPSSGSVPGTVGTVSTVVNGLLGLLPSGHPASPKPSPPATKGSGGTQVTAPSPNAKASDSGLVGGLLGLVGGLLN